MSLPDNVVRCSACGGKQFHKRYREAVEPSRFLWWRIKGRQATIELLCLECGKREERAPGSIQPVEPTP